MTSSRIPSRRIVNAAIVLGLLLTGCASVGQKLATQGACPRAAIEICKQSGAVENCRCIRRSAFSGDALIRVP